MRDRKWRAVYRGAAFLAALALTLPSTGVAARGEEPADTPPTVIWLDGDYDSAIYLGEGVMEARSSYVMQEKGGLRGHINTIMDLNGEVIPGLNGVYLGEEGFYGGYILGGAYQKGFGLYDREGNTVVPLAFETEAEAWAQVGLTPPPGDIYSEFPKQVSILDPDYDPSEDPSGFHQRFLYGVMAEDGTMLLDYQKYDVWFDEDADYSSIVENGRCGLMKNPMKKDLISDWARPEVTAALAAGLVPERCQGYYTYEITRSQMAALLVRYAERTLGEELPLPADHPFTDTQDEYIEKAYAAGIVQGTGEGIFHPDKVVTREQLAAMLYRTMVLVDTGWGTEGPEPAGYEDFAAVSGWAREAVSALLARGVMRGVSGTRIAPKTFCTTEQAILLVSRLAAGGQT